MPDQEILLQAIQRALDVVSGEEGGPRPLLTRRRRGLRRGAPLPPDKVIEKVDAVVNSSLGKRFQKMRQVNAVSV